MVAEAIDRVSHDLGVEVALREMLRDKRQKRLSPETLETYDRNLRRFIGFFGAGRPVSEISADVVRDYADAILERGVTDDTYAHYMRDLKVFLRWLAAEGRIAAAPRVVLPTLHPKDRLNLVTEPDYDRLIRAVDGRSAWNLRDVALVSLLWDSGARISELTGLDVGDVNLASGEASVLGKGRKRRTIFFGDETAARIMRYRRRLELAANPDALFVSRTLLRLNRDAAAAILDRAKAKSRVTCDVNPHNFRHSFATRFLRNGGNPLHLRRILGHTTLKMTDWYVSLITEDIKEAHSQFGDRKPRRLR